MKNEILMGGILILLSAGMCFAVQSQISYTCTDLGLGRWQYDYSVSNISLSFPIEEFTIYFDEDIYRNLAVGTVLPTGWDVIIFQPEPILRDGGGYDALASGAGINIGETFGGFSVQFDWLGSGTPLSQQYEIINTDTFVAIESGMTVPEPSSIALLIGSIVLLMRKSKHNQPKL